MVGKITLTVTGNFYKLFRIRNFVCKWIWKFIPYWFAFDASYAKLPVPTNLVNSPRLVSTSQYRVVEFSDIIVSIRKIEFPERGNLFALRNFAKPLDSSGGLCYNSNMGEHTLYYHKLEICFLYEFFANHRKKLVNLESAGSARKSCKNPIFWFSMTKTGWKFQKLAQLFGPICALLPAC